MPKPNTVAVPPATRSTWQAFPAGRCCTSSPSHQLLKLDQYDCILVSFSGGKDSLACVVHLLELGVDPSKIELWHQCVDGDPENGGGLMD